MEHNRDKPPVKKERSAWWVKLRTKQSGTPKAALNRLPAQIGGWCKANFALEGKTALRVLWDGLLLQNPVLVLFFGLCGVLAASTDVRPALALGITATCVLLCSNLVVSLLRGQLPQKGRLFCLLAVVVVFTTAADAGLTALFPALRAQIGIFLPLLAVSGMFLTRAEQFAAQNTPGYALADALATGLGYTLVLTLLAALRELLGNGTFAGLHVFGADFLPILLLLSPVGGFLLLGLLAAGAQWLLQRNWTKKPKGGGEK